MHLNFCSHLIFFCIFYGSWWIMFSFTTGTNKKNTYFFLLEKKDFEIYSVILYLFLNCYANFKMLPMLWFGLFVEKQRSLWCIFFSLLGQTNIIYQPKEVRPSPLLHSPALYCLMCLCFLVQLFNLQQLSLHFYYEKKVMWNL